jgi:hypothetical protein
MRPGLHPHWQRTALFSKAPSTPPESSSRQDARIALLMQAEGYSRETVYDVILRSAPELRKDEKRNRRRYAARTAAYTFGLAGDMELADMPQAPQPPHIEPKPKEELPQPMPPEAPVEETWHETPRLRMR